MASLQFLGAAGTVTGSRYLVRANGKAVLVDVGLFQGLKELRLRNWAPPAVPPEEVDAAVLTHAHIDHSGGLPLFVRRGFSGRTWCTPGTRDLCGLLLPDSGRLHEEEARYANKKGYSKHAPALPLYTEADAHAALRTLAALPYAERKEIVPGFAITFHRAGHILGSATVELEVAGGPRLLFSGDLGRYGVPILTDPEPAVACDALLVECTYGDRLHGGERPRDALAREVNAASERGGAIVVPAFAVGRTQEILFDLRALEQAKAIPELRVFLDSPMALDATPLYAGHAEDHDEEMRRLIARGVQPLRPARLELARSPEQSKRINDVKGACIIISASGMATGGRVLHHLKARLPDPKTTVLLVGYQAAGTRGASLQGGAKTVRMMGEDVPVAARVVSLSGFSAHGDYAEVDRWLAGVPRPPQRTFCVHGEPASLEATRARLEKRGWTAYVPKHLETVAL